MCHLHVVCCLTLYDSPFYSLLSIFSLIFLFILLIIFIFHVEDAPCALLLMKSQALWPRTILSHWTKLQILQKIRDDLRERNIEPEKFTDQITSMSMMFLDIDWTKKGNDGICISNSEKVKEYAKRFSQRHWTFLGPGDEK